MGRPTTKHYVDRKSLKHTVLNGRSPSNPCVKSSGNPGEQKEYMTKRGWKAAKREVLWINWVKFTWINIDWSNKHRTYTGHHQLLCIYIIVISLVLLWDSDVMGHWLLCMLLGFFSFCWTVLSYHILFCPAWLLTSLLFHFLNFYYSSLIYYILIAASPPSTLPTHSPCLLFPCP